MAENENMTGVSADAVRIKEEKRKFKEEQKQLHQNQKKQKKFRMNFFSDNNIYSVMIFS